MNTTALDKLNKLCWLITVKCSLLIVPINDVKYSCINPADSLVIESLYSLVIRHFTPRHFTPRHFTPDTLPPDTLPPVLTL